MVCGAADKKANNIQARSPVARNLENMSGAAQRREEQKWAISKPKVDNARRLRGIFFIDPTDAEFKETIKKRSGRDTSHAPGHHQRFVESTYSASYSGWDDDKAWSSQEWKSDDMMEVRTGRLVYEQPPGLFTEHTDKFIVDDDDTDSDTDEESDMSILSRPFLHRVNDRVRKIQDQSSKDATQDSNKHSLVW